MFRMKRMAVAALAALMIAGAVPALAADAAADADTDAARQEVVVDSGKRSHKKKRASGDEGDAANAHTRRKPAESAEDGGETVDGATSATKKRDKRSGGDASDSADGKKARPSRKPCRKPEKKASAAESGDAVTAA